MDHVPYPVKFEIALLMIVVSVLFNIGFYISLGNCKRNFKKSIITLLFPNGLKSMKGYDALVKKIERLKEAA